MRLKVAMDNMVDIIRRVMARRKGAGISSVRKATVRHKVVATSNVPRVAVMARRKEADINNVRKAAAMVLVRVALAPEALVVHVPVVLARVALAAHDPVDVPVALAAHDPVGVPVALVVRGVDAPAALPRNCW